MSHNDPLVSIIMLTYNRANYIELAISSVLSQTYQNWELWVLDDGSTDNTPEVMKRYNDDSRIKYIQDPVNKGLGRKRLESLSFPTGPYIAIVDSDDMWIDNTKLAAQVAHLESNPLCAVVGTQITLIDAEGTQFGTGNYRLDDKSIRNKILVRNQFAHSSVMMRKRMVDQTAGYRADFAPSEDLDLFLQLGQFGTFANLSDTMLAYRVHKKGESSLKSKVVRVVLLALETHKSEYPNYLLAHLKFTLILLVAKLRGR
jgi:glycosyltransferase involved in cell wall biosynthesis